MTNNNRSNRKYSKEEKENLIARMFPPENITPGKLSDETGISKSTLATWKTKANKGLNLKKDRRTISSQEKFIILMETYSLSEIELGKSIVLHSDNGAPMKSHTLKSKLEFLGVLSSYSRPRVSNDNPYSEAHFKTMKYNSLLISEAVIPDLYKSAIISL